MDTDGTIEVRVREYGEVDNRTLGFFPPSQLNALFGVVDNSTMYWWDPGDEWRFSRWQWCMPENEIDPPYIELIFTHDE